MPDRKRTWFITGCSTGFGRELSLQLIARGENVVATARRVEAIADLAALSPESVLATRLDVIDNASVSSAVGAAIARFGCIDVLVNNAGYALVGSAEEVSDAEARALFDTNFFGFADVTKAVLPSMRKQRCGHIINISSMGGIFGGMGMAWYGASKFAMAGLSEALAQEAGPLGIKVTIIEPGGHRTEAIAQARMADAVIEDYAGTAGRMRLAAASASRNEPGDAGLAAKAIIAVADSADPPLHLPLGADALQRLDRKLAMLQADREKWLELILSTAVLQ